MKTVWYPSDDREIDDSIQLLSDDTDGSMLMPMFIIISFVVVYDE